MCSKYAHILNFTQIGTLIIKSKTILLKSEDFKTDFFVKKIRHLFLTDRNFLHKHLCVRK